VSKALLSSSNLVQTSCLVQTLEGTGQVSDQNQGIIRTFLLLSAAVGGQTVEAPFGLLWMAGAKYYGTGRQSLLHKAGAREKFLTFLPRSPLATGCVGD
jgi:hypothetical protein